MQKLQKCKIGKPAAKYQNMEKMENYKNGNPPVQKCDLLRYL